MRRHLVGILTLIVVATTQSPTALAQEDLEPSVVFFEMYVKPHKGAKTPEYVRAVEEDIRQFNQFSSLLRVDASERIRSIMITPKKRQNDAKLQAIEKMVAEGDKLLYDNPKKAVEVLNKAKMQLKDIVENISLDSKRRKIYFNTQMLLVRSHLDNQSEKKAHQIMTEVVRVFEDEYRVTEDNYHPKVVELYKSVINSLKDKRTASLKITSNPPGCTVFINGRAKKQKTPYTYKGLYPGPLRIQITKGKNQSMVRKVEVTANGTKSAHIDLAYETALTFSPDKFGITFENNDSVQKNMALFASQLGSFLEVDYVAVAGITETAKGSQLTGYLVKVKEKQLVRHKSFPVKSNVVSNRRIHEMAAFLAGVNLVKKAPEPVYKPWYHNILGWSVAGAGVIALSTGAVFYGKYMGHVSEVEKSYTPGNIEAQLKDKEAEADAGNSASTLGHVLTGLGLALIAGGATVFALVPVEDTTAPATTSQSSDIRFYGAPVVLPHGGGVFGGFSF